MKSDILTEKHQLGLGGVAIGTAFEKGRKDLTMQRSGYTPKGFTTLHGLFFIIYFIHLQKHH